MSSILQLTLLFNVIAIPATLTVGLLRQRYSDLTLLKGILGIWIGVLWLMAGGTFALTPLLIAGGLGLVTGSTQSICRGMFAEIIPPEQSSELFGLHALVSKVSAIVGPLLFGVVSSATGNQRLAVLCLIPFFLLGGWVLLRMPWFVSESASKSIT